MCPAKWQWNTQFPGVVGRNDNDIDPPMGTMRMFCNGCFDAGTIVSARKPPERETLK
jgi:hypothetical protein